MRIHKIRTPHICKEGRIFSWTSLIYSFGLGLMLPIFPGFIESIVKHEAYVGYFYSVMSISMVLAGLTSAYFFRKYPRMKILVVSLVVNALLMMSFVFVNNFYQLFVIDFLRVFASLYVMMSMALMVHAFAKAKDLGKTEGFYFLFNNIGYFAGPLVGGIIAKYGGVEPVFVLSGLSLLVALSYIIHQHLVEEHPSLALPHKTKKVGVGLENVKLFLQSKNRIGAYLVSVALISWMSFKQIVIPLFVLAMGFGADTAGLIISLTIVPCLLFEMPIGKYADEKGFRIPIALGFLIITFSLLAISISPYFILDAALFIIANIGAALIEPLHDVYFFKNVKKDEEDVLFGIFATADPIGRFVGPAIISTSLIFFPFQGLFIVFACIYAFAGILSLLIKE
ncbi:MFS transporter [Candidatus Peregrinibacteria bacterium]|jgi:MFS family permease|nr:MFS transporter [Candidatus Peregrinibacteria bacterium]MBT4147713.1 MFS transporter [Candidatus Peregrinibacteria bacterium]MBT4365791.1 MFS transporter [Candidatus Peregrinibacteria bacterium]MBT4455742.1 MFS transporter [Candidatus Peregrinibacteria bacterium]